MGPCWLDWQGQVDDTTGPDGGQIFSALAWDLGARGVLGRHETLGILRLHLSNLWDGGAATPALAKAGIQPARSERRRQTLQSRW